MKLSQITVNFIENNLVSISLKKKKTHEMTFTMLLYLFKYSAPAAALYLYPYYLSGLLRTFLHFIPATFSKQLYSNTYNLTRFMNCFSANFSFPLTTGIVFWLSLLILSCSTLLEPDSSSSCMSGVQSVRY